MESVMDLNHLHIGAFDVEASVKFYQDYFDFHKRQKHDNGNYFVFNRDGFMIAIVKEAEIQMPPWFHFGFRLPKIENVEDLCKKMTDEGCTISEELTKYDDFVFFKCKDPAGIELEVYWSPGPLKLKN